MEITIQHQSYEGTVWLHNFFADKPHWDMLQYNLHNPDRELLKNLEEAPDMIIPPDIKKEIRKEAEELLQHVK